jgi:hypothetical protein
VDSANSYDWNNSSRDMTTYTHVLIKQMFVAIDRGDFTSLDQYSIGDIACERTGFSAVSGFENLVPFIRNNAYCSRQLSIAVENDNEVASGRFRGTLKDGLQVDERFRTGANSRVEGFARG